MENKKPQEIAICGRILAIWAFFFFVISLWAIVNGGFSNNGFFGMFVITSGFVISSVGLLKHKKWARRLAIGFSIFIAVIALHCCILVLMKEIKDMLIRKNYADFILGLLS